MTAPAIRRIFSSAHLERFQSLPADVRKRFCAGMFCYAAGPACYAAGGYVAWAHNGWLGSGIAATGFGLSWGLGDILVGDALLRLFFPRQYAQFCRAAVAGALSTRLNHIRLEPADMMPTHDTPPALVRRGRILPPLAQISYAPAVPTA